VCTINTGPEEELGSQNANFLVLLGEFLQLVNPEVDCVLLVPMSDAALATVNPQL
jgi:hypothetical protein